VFYNRLGLEMERIVKQRLDEIQAQTPPQEWTKDVRMRTRQQIKRSVLEKHYEYMELEEPRPSMEAWELHHDAKTEIPDWGRLYARGWKLDLT